MIKLNPASTTILLCFILVVQVYSARGLSVNMQDLPADKLKAESLFSDSLSITVDKNGSSVDGGIKQEDMIQAIELPVVEPDQKFVEEQLDLTKRKLAEPEKFTRMIKAIPEIPQTNLTDLISKTRKLNPLPDQKKVLKDQFLQHKDVVPDQIKQKSELLGGQEKKIAEGVAFVRDYDENSLENLIKNEIDFAEHFDQEIKNIPQLRQKLLTREHVPDEVLKALDSLKRIEEAKDNHLMKAQQKIREGKRIKTIIFDERKNRILPKDMFIDLLIGFSAERNRIHTLSPTVGYKIAKRFSIGGGMVLNNLFNEEYRLRPTVGIRTFCRYYIIKDAFYIHTEGTFHNPGFSFGEQAEEEVKWDKSLSSGLGYSAQFFDNKGVSVQFLYYLIKPVSGNLDVSPFIFRVGLKVF